MMTCSDNLNLEQAGPAYKGCSGKKDLSSTTYYIVFLSNVCGDFLNQPSNNWLIQPKVSKLELGPT